MYKAKNVLFLFSLEYEKIQNTARHILVQVPKRKRPKQFIFSFKKICQKVALKRTRLKGIGNNHNTWKLSQRHIESAQYLYINVRSTKSQNVFNVIYVNGEGFIVENLEMQIG